MQINITNKDISWAERILLPTGEHFDEEQKAVIKCFETKDICACPGSGKTTALLAKLLILSRHMPLKNNKGVCILTHTNVAIDEIKSHADFASNKLFNYPNHFGTIQSFVDKYLAIPAYINKFKRRPLFINNESYFDKVEKLRKYLGRKTNAFCYRSGRKNYPYSLRFNNFALDDDNICQQLNLSLNDTTQKSIYEKLKWLKKKILMDGVLSYDDAYFLAANYVKRYPTWKDIISRRFAYVFIDEMQDTNTTQTELLDDLFNENVITQRIGDLNQAIFDYDADLECGWKINNDRTMFITGSKRFSTSIASKVGYFCVFPQNITGVTRQNEIAPVIIVYNDNTVQQVLNQFAEIIIKNNLHQHKNRTFKAVGWRGKPHDSKRTIPSYWKGYSKEIKVKRTEFNNLKSYLIPQPDSLIISKGANFYRRRLVEAFLKCLRIAEITDHDRTFTDKKLYRCLLENDPNFYKYFRTRLAAWCLRIHRKEEVFDEIRNFLTNEFKIFFDYQISDELTNFINSSDLELDNRQEALKNNNIYKCSFETTEIEIEVSTIHGVKGETHTATCYLETFCYKYDIKKIMDYMKGQYTEPTQKKIKQNLKMAFVGMSRPSHLLCVAVHCDNISGQEEALRNSGWDVNNDLCTSNSD